MRVRSHRRIHLNDLLAYREEYRAERHRRIGDLIRISEELGDYDVTPEELATFRAQIDSFGDDEE